MHPAGQDRYTGDNYLSENPDWHVEDSEWKTNQILAILNRQDLKPQTIGEIGCGAGEILTQLSTKVDDAVHFVGWDISPKAIEMCRMRESDRIRCMLGDLTQEQDVRFDTLLIIDVIEHVEDYRGFLGSLRGKADNFVFNIPMDFNVYTSLRHDSLARGRHHLGHIHHFNRSTALATLEDTGYTILRSNYAFPLKDPSMRRKAPIMSKLLRNTRRMVSSVAPNLSVKLLGGASLMVLAE